MSTRMIKNPLGNTKIYRGFDIKYIPERTMYEISREGRIVAGRPSFAMVKEYIDRLYEDRKNVNRGGSVLMKTNPYPMEHAARLFNPSRHYARYRRENDALGKGVSVIWGVPKNIEKFQVEAQAVRFDANKFTPAQAKAWLRKHGMLKDVIKFEPATHKYAKRTHKNPFNLPDDLTKLTNEQKEELIDWYSNMSMKELRKRQNYVDAQMEVAYNNKIHKAIDNLAVMQAVLMRAIMVKNFGK